MDLHVFTASMAASRVLPGPLLVVVTVVVEGAAQCRLHVCIIQSAGTSLLTRTLQEAFRCMTQLASNLITSPAYRKGISQEWLCRPTRMHSLLQHLWTFLYLGIALYIPKQED